MMVNALSPFREAVRNPAAPACQDKKTIGYLCSYAPEELIHAAGCHPMRLLSSKTGINLADNHLQAYCCSPVRGVLADGLAGRLDYLDGIVFPHTCDAMQRLSDIWRLNMGQAFFADLALPAKLTTASARAYLTQVLEKFRADLGAFTGQAITDQAIVDAIALFNRIRAGLERIYTLKSAHPGLITGSDLLTVVKAAMIMDREILDTRIQDLTRALTQEVPDIPQTNGSASRPAKRLILTGSVCDMPDLHPLIEAAGGTVVADDLCTGQRWFKGKVPEGLAPMAGLTARYADRLVCPAKHSGTTARAEALVRLARETNACGVIFVLIKFCDPHAFDYPYLRDALDKAGIRHLCLETDEQQQGNGQLTTRLETFIHMI